MQNISAHDAKSRFGQLLDTARREPVVIERHGRAVAVVVSKEEYDALNDISGTGGASYCGKLTPGFSTARPGYRAGCRPAG